MRAPALRSRLRTVAAGALTVVAFLLVWFSLVAPNDLAGVSAGAFARIPFEALIVVALLLVVPRRAGRYVAVVFGVALGLLVIVKVLDTGFGAALGRPFNPADDLSYLGSAIDLLADSVGRTKANIAAVAAGLAAAAVLVLTPLAVLRLTRIVDRHRTASLQAVVALGMVWVVCAVLGLQLIPGTPIASSTAAGLAAGEVRQVYTGIKDQQAFARAAAHDPLANTPGADLLTGLRGKDVLVVFVESYGRVAVQDSSFSSGVNAVLDAGTERLGAAGFAAQSAFLTSPTYGGISWLAHSTLQSGPVDQQPAALRRRSWRATACTLSAAFKRAGWRTVSDMPLQLPGLAAGRVVLRLRHALRQPQRRLRGPRLRLRPHPRPVHPGSVPAPRARPAPTAVRSWPRSTWCPATRPGRRCRSWSRGTRSVTARCTTGCRSRACRRSVALARPEPGTGVVRAVHRVLAERRSSDSSRPTATRTSCSSCSATTNPPRSSAVGAPTATCPITIISHDPAVLDRISSWGWEAGMRPSPDAPVWPMDAFRDRFLEAYGP